MSQVSLFTLTKGIATFVPGAKALFTRSTAGTSKARYCYSVWLRHLILAHRAGLAWPVRTVAELGPGDSIGIGLAAILSGAQNYVGLDVFPYAGNTAHLDLFEELVQLFRAKTPVPDAAELPEVWPVLDTYGFPHEILTDDILAQSLAAERLETIRRSLRSGLKFDDKADTQTDKVDSKADNGNAAINSDVTLRYAAPWFTKDLIREQSVDLAYSQAVMEHVSDVPETYKLLRKWLKPGALMSHTIDYSSHHYTRDWNGHWTVPAPLWRVVAGNRKFCINRHSHSEHTNAMQAAGFRLRNESVRRGPALERAQLASEFRAFTDGDLSANSAFVQATA